MSKKALLVGLNYNGGLRGCGNDVQRMKKCLLKHLGFMEKDITILIDTDPASTEPSAFNILSALLSLVRSAEPGDMLFFHFSGHGNRRISVPPDSNNTGFVEFIIGADWECITDNTFRELVHMVPSGCSFTILADCCHSGGLIEGAKEQIGDSTRVKFERSGNEDIPGDYCYVSNRVKFGLDKNKCKEHVLTRGPSNSSLPGEGVLLSACQSYEVAKEVSFTHNIHGVFSNAILATLEETCGQVTNWDLVEKASKKIKSLGFSQTPGLYCSDRHAHAIFLSADPVDTQRVKGQRPLGSLVAVPLLALMFVSFHLMSRYHQRL